MKLRLRIGQRTERIDISDEEASEKTLRQLSSVVAKALRLEPGSFELSLNGRDPINGSPDDLLETFGIVSGDLIKVLVPSEPDQSPSSQNGETSKGMGAKPKSRPSPDTRINGSLATTRKCTTSERRREPGAAVSEQERGNHATSEDEMSTEEKEAREQLAKLDRMAEMGEKISEPMLCRDAEGDKIPLRLKQLCEEIKPERCGDALCLVLHVLMVETGFYAQQTASSTSTDQPSSSHMEGTEEGMGEDLDLDPDPLATLPRGWKTGTSYRLPYQHAECRGAECTLAGVSMGTVLLIHGLIGKKIHATMQLKPALYASHVDGSVSFTNLAYLSRNFKDTIVYPLLAAMRADLGLPPLHGLLALFPEIQLKILSFLDLPNLLIMSTVSHHFNSLISDPLLWRQLLLRDFGGKVTDRHCNWKNVYKERYHLKKLREQLRSRIQNSFYPPGRRPFAFVPPIPHPLPGIYPPGYRGQSSGKTQAFRESYGRLGELRSTLPAVPVVAMTATATTDIRSKVAQSLGMRNYVTIVESPDKQNIKHVVLGTKKRDFDDSLKFLVDELKTKGRQCERMILYCQSRKLVAELYAMFCSELPKSVSAYVQMYHTNTEQDIQEMIIADMGDPDGEIRVLIATIAFGMGVNVKGMHSAIMIGRPSELDDYLQMAGRVGRDGKQSMCLTVKYPGDIVGRGVSKSMARFLKGTECRRGVINENYMSSGTVIKKHECCDICAVQCMCSENKCGAEPPRLESLARNHLDMQGEATEFPVVIPTPAQQDKLKRCLDDYRNELVRECPDHLYSGKDIASGLPECTISKIMLEINVHLSRDQYMRRYHFGSSDVAQKTWEMYLNALERTDMNLPDNSSTPVQEDDSDGSDGWSGNEFADAIADCHLDDSD